MKPYLVPVALAIALSACAIQRQPVAAIGTMDENSIEVLTLDGFAGSADVARLAKSHCGDSYTVSGAKPYDDPLGYQATSRMVHCG